MIPKIPVRDPTSMQLVDNVPKTPMPGCALCKLSNDARLVGGKSAKVCCSFDQSTPSNCMRSRRCEVVKNHRRCIGQSQYPVSPALNLYESCTRWRRIMKGSTSLAVFLRREMAGSTCRCSMSQNLLRVLCVLSNAVPVAHRLEISSISRRRAGSPLGL